MCWKNGHRSLQLAIQGPISKSLYINTRGSRSRLLTVLCGLHFYIYQRCVTSQFGVNLAMGRNRGISSVSFPLGFCFVHQFEWRLCRHFPSFWRPGFFHVHLLSSLSIHRPLPSASWCLLLMRIQRRIFKLALLFFSTRLVNSGQSAANYIPFRPGPVIHSSVPSPRHLQPPLPCSQSLHSVNAATDLFTLYYSKESLWLDL